MLASFAPFSAAAEPTSGPDASAVPTQASAPAKAREVTARATVRFEEGDYEAAVAGFLQAYDLLEGDPRQPALLNNIAVCYERMFRYDLALKYYKRYLREGATDDADRAEVQRVVQGLRGLLGKLRITTNVPAEAWVSQDLQVEVPGEVWVPAGTHVLEIRASGYESERREVRVAPRSEQDLDFTLQQKFEGVAPRYFWAGTGLTAAALITGAGFGLRAVRQDHLAEERLDENRVSVEDAQRIARLQRSADVSFGVAALFGVSTVVLFFLTNFGEREAGRQGRVGRLSVDGLAGPSGLGVRLSGSLR